jgi:hypothetical protein
MMPFAGVLITARTERSELSTRLQALDALIMAIESYERLVQPAPIVAAPVVVPPLPAPRTVPNSTAKVHPNTNTDRMAAIESALKTHGPLPTREVARIVGGSKFVVKQALQRLKRAGRLTSEGVTNGQRWTLPGQKAATKTLADIVPRATPQTGGGPACRICECAFKDHDPTSGRCFGRSGKCVCREFRS